MTVHYKMSAGAAEPLGDRTFAFVISTGDLDRENDRIRPDAWDTREYEKNPVVMFGHDYKSLPVARTVALRAGGDALRAHAQFPPRGIYPFADTVHDMTEAGYLTGASAGFTPGKFELNAYGGKDYISGHKLLEWSIVPIPANPQAGRVPTTRAGAHALAVKSFLGITDSRALRLQPHMRGLDAIRLKSWLGGKSDQAPAMYCPKGRDCPAKASQIHPNQCPARDCPLQSHTTGNLDDRYSSDHIAALRDATLAMMRRQTRDLPRQIIREVVKPMLDAHLMRTTGRID